MSLPPWYIPDADGQDLRPDPDAITTAAKLIEAMRQYRIWAGNPSFRTLSARCRHRVSATAFHKALHTDELPRLEVVHDFIGACGSTEEYRQAFEQAWQRVAVGGVDQVVLDALLGRLDAIDRAVDVDAGFRDLLERSSLGTPAAKKLRARADPEVVVRILRRAGELASEPADEEAMQQFREWCRHYDEDPAERERIRRIAEEIGLDDEGRDQQG